VFRTIVIDSVFSKSSSYSALERLKTIQNGWSYFLQYPLLGVGWGSVTSHDLVVKLLANIGVLGLLSFAVVIMWLASRLYRGIRQRRDDVALTQMVWLLSLIMLIFMNAISEFAYVLGHFWLILGVSMSCATLSGYSIQPRAISFPAMDSPGFMPGSETTKST
jgi:O-antigen ligase